KICERRKEIYNIGEVSKVIIEFLNLAKAREWFEKQPLRQIQQEVEYVGKDGSLYRFDRVVIDPDRIIVIDFKTGKEGMSYYRTQLKNYMKILSALNPQKIIKGYLAYIDTRKVEELDYYFAYFPYVVNFLSSFTYLFNNFINNVLPRYQHSDITILAKRNAQVEMIVEWLTEKNIPSASFSSLNIRKRKIIREIMSLL
ncbi:unnamed protein product, partial [marine sediment metagenome]